MLNRLLPKLACLGSLLASGALADEPELRPVVRIRLSHPDQQLKTLIRLFDGARSPSPAAALAAWKRASREPNRLGKPIEAMIAALNPRMVGELKTVDGAELAIEFEPLTGRPLWSVLLPGDEGTFAALGSAFVLSGGEAEPPIGDLSVDRLAGPGSALIAKTARGTILAGSLDQLTAARTRLEASNPGKSPPLDDPPGIRLLLETDALKRSEVLNLRRLGAFLRPSKAPQPNLQATVEARFRLDGNRFLGTIGELDLLGLPRAVIDPSWFDWTPKDRALVSFGIGVDPDPRSWESLFELADRIEKQDPQKATIASLRVRLDLLCRLSGIRLEPDLLGHLQGISGWMGADRQSISSALLLLHLDDPEAAERVVSRIKPLPGSGDRPPLEPDRPRWLGKVEGRPIRITRFDRVVALGWGDEVLESSLRARGDPERSDGSLIRLSLEPGRLISLAGVVWPGRIPAIIPVGSPLEQSLSEARPIAWSLSSQPPSTGKILVNWPALDATVRRFLNLIPLDPPPDH